MIYYCIFWLITTFTFYYDVILFFWLITVFTFYYDVIVFSWEKQFIIENKLFKLKVNIFFVVNLIF